MNPPDSLISGTPVKVEKPINESCHRNRPSRASATPIALRLASEGMRVVLAARDEKLLGTRRPSSARTNSLVAALDLRLPDSAAKVVDAAVAKFGAVDILVNNAGATKRGEFETLTDDDFLDGFALKYLRRGPADPRRLAAFEEAGRFDRQHRRRGGRTPGAMFAIGGSVNAAILSFTKAMAEKGIQEASR